MKTVKVLFLDDMPGFLPDLTEYDIKLEVLQEAHWSTRDVYYVSPRICETVKKLTTSKEVDIVVVGNNLGAGVTKAMSIADDMKEMTVVVWNFYHKGLEANYSAIGFKHFGSRNDLCRLIPAMLGIA